MGQNTILAAAKTAATSTDVTVAAGATVTIGIFTDDAAGIPGNEGVKVYIDTPSKDRLLKALTGNGKPEVIVGPCTVRAKRPATTVNIGVYTET